MKKRGVLFGYKYENGETVICEKEALVVQEIFYKDRAGKSLLELLRELNEKNIEYMPGVAIWDKARIVRLLEDERYTGEKRYPILIDRKEYDEIQKIKKENCNQKGIDRKADIFQMAIPVSCPRCNKRLRRVVDSRDKNPIRWRCQSAKCSFSKIKHDESLFDELTELMNLLIEKPETIELSSMNDCEPGDVLRGLNGEITKMLNGGAIDSEEVRRKMLKVATLKYAELSTVDCKAERIKDIFMAAEPLNGFSLVLLERTVDEIKFHEDGTIGIVLENGQEITKEMRYAIER